MVSICREKTQNPNTIYLFENYIYKTFLE